MKKKVLTTCYIIMTTIAVLTVLYAGIAFKTSEVSTDTSEVYSFDEGWQYELNGVVKTINSLPAYLDEVEPNIAYTIVNTLPDLEVEGYCLRFRSSNQRVRVWVDDNLIYTFGIGDSRQFSLTPGSAWNYVDIPKGSYGSEIKVEFTEVYESTGGFVSSFSISDRGTLIYELLSNNIVNVYICLVTALIGILLILYHLLSKMKTNRKGAIAYLGIESLIVSAWSLLETNLVQIIVPKVGLLTLITFFCLMMVTIPMLAFLQNAYYYEQKKLFNSLYALSVANFAILTILQFTGIADFYETVLSSHVLILATFITIIYVSLKDWLSNKNHDSRYLFICTMILLSFTAVDFIRFYFGAVSDFSLGFRIGFLILISMLTIHYYIRLVALTEKGVQAEMYEKLAYEDILTGCKNRTYFEKCLLKIEHNKNDLVNSKGIMIVTFDMNYLKMINDTYGHKRGDDQLIACSNAIKKAFSNCGTCFRTGGDEFTVIMDTADNEVLEKAINEMKMEELVFNKDNEGIKLEIAYGYANYKKGLDKNLDGVVSRADRMMYERKARMKNGQPV